MYPARFFALGLLGILLLAEVALGKQLVDVGDPGDTTYGAGIVYQASGSLWGERIVIDEKTARYTMDSDPDNNSPSLWTTLEARDYVIGVKAYDDLSANIELWMDYNDGGSWCDYYVGTIRFRGRDEWRNDLFFLKGNAISDSMDWDSESGKQICFRFWDEGKNWLTHEFALDELSVLDGERDIIANGEPMKMVKCDPVFRQTRWQNGELDPYELVPFWKSEGFNTIMFIDAFNGRVLHPTSTAQTYDPTIYGKGDFVADLVDAAKRYGMELAVGCWRPFSQELFDTHPDWWSVDESGNYTQEMEFCHNSPFFDIYYLPVFKELQENYGINKFFFQELWFGWSRNIPGERTCYCDNCMRKFNQEYSYSYTRSELAAAVAENLSLRNQWDKFHFDSLFNTIKKAHYLLDDDTVLMWHNCSGIDRTNTYNEDIDFLENDPSIGSFGEPYVDYLGGMILYPDDMFFDGLAGWDLPFDEPINLYSAGKRARWANMRVGNRDKLFVETVGRGMINRLGERKEIGDICLVVLGMGEVKHFLYEEDDHAAEDLSGETWRGLQDVFSKWLHLFDKGTLQTDQDWVTYSSSNQVQASVWKLDNIWGESNIDAALLINMSNEVQTYTLHPQGEDVLYDVRQEEFLDDQMVSVPAQTVKFVCGVSSSVDVYAPTLEKVSVTGANRVQVGFNEAVDPITGQDPSNYRVLSAGSLERTLDVGESGDTSGTTKLNAGEWQETEIIEGRSIRRNLTTVSNSSFVLTVEPGIGYTMVFETYMMM